MPLSGTELDRIANDIVNTDLEVRPHSASPGANGTANRIGTATATAAAASWNTVSDGSGDVTYGAALTFGVLDTGSAQTVTHYSLWRSSAFVGYGALSSSVAVPANDQFQIDASTIIIRGATS